MTERSYSGKLFADAEAVWTAASYSGTGALLDLTGNGHDAQLGSTSGSDTNDPTFLAHSGTNYVRFPGASTDTLQLDGIDALNPSLLFEVRVDIAMDDYTPAASEAPIAKWGSGGNSWLLYRTTGGAFEFVYNSGGNVFATSDVWTITDGSRIQIRVVHDLTAGDTDFFSRVSTLSLDDDGDAWTARGGETGNTAGGFTGTDPTTIGSHSTANPFNGDVYGAIVWYDGVKVVDVVPSDIEPTRTALDLDGTGDYATVPDEAALDITGNLTLIASAVLDDWTPASDNVLIRKGDTTNYGLQIAATGTVEFRTATTDYATTGTITATNGSRLWVKAVYTASAGTVDVSLSSDGTNYALFEQITSVPTSLTANASSLTVGANAAGGDEVFGQVLTATVIDDGTTVLDVDFTNKTPGASTITAVTGQTVTLVADAAIVPDGQLRIHDSTPTYLDLPGAGADTASLPDPSTFSGDIDIKAMVSSPTLNGANHQVIASQWANSWLFQVDGVSDTLEFVYRISAANNIKNSTVSHGIANGQTFWARVTRNATTGDVVFYTSTDTTTNPDEVTWAQLGATVAGVTGAMDSTGIALTLGAQGGGSSPWDGEMYRVVVLDGTTAVLDADFTTLAPGVTSFTEDSSNAATVTINGNASIAGGSNKWDVNRATSGLVTALVDRPMFVLDGVDDYFEIADHDDLDFDAGVDDGTILMAWRLHNNVGVDNVLISKMTNYYADTGWSLATSTNIANVSVALTYGTSGVFDNRNAATDAFDSEIHIWAWRLASSTIEAIYDLTYGGPAAMAQDLSSTKTVRIGMMGDGGEPVAGEFIAAAIWRRALTDAEISQVTDILTGAEALPETLYANGPWHQGSWRAIRRLFGANTSKADVARKWNKVYEAWNG